jgi:hypothetical protein
LSLVNIAAIGLVLYYIINHPNIISGILGKATGGGGGSSSSGPCKHYASGGTTGDCSAEESGGDTVSKGGGTVSKGGGGGVVSGGGTTSTGSSIYRKTGRTCGCSNEGEKTLHTSKGTCTTSRVNCNNCGLQNYEATGILQFTSDCSCGGDEATIKHLGPDGHHSNNPGCCWEIGTVTQGGKVGFNMEGPHPDTTNPKPEKVLGNVGSLANKKIGMKSIVWKSGTGFHHEIWVDPTGSGTSWKKYGQREVTSWGASKKTSTFPSNQQVEFRNDCKGAKWLSSSIVEISPGTKAGAVRAMKAKAMRSFN